MTILEILEKTTDFLKQKEVPSPRLQIELLLAHVLGISRFDIYMCFDRPLSHDELDRLRPLVKRRAQHEPLQYILGETNFCGLNLTCRPTALIPRPETETLVEIVNNHFSSSPPQHITDIGTGTGAIALALACCLPDSTTISATDISPQTLELAHENQQRHPPTSRVQWHCCDLIGDLQPDAVITNLPYLTSEEMRQLPADVRYEPTMALDGGEDGLAPARRLLQSLPASVSFIAMELGRDNATTFAEELRQSGWPKVQQHADLNDIPRFIIAQRS